MHFAGCEGVHACCVRDVTNLGAGIRFNGLDIVPLEFGISFDNFRTVRRCRLIWRDGDFVGVTFESWAPIAATHFPADEGVEPWTIFEQSSKRILYEIPAASSPCTGPPKSNVAD
jgi:hypothetical protein